MANDDRAETIKQLARKYAELAISTLVDVAENDEEKGSARVMAAKSLLERGFGAPDRKVEQKIDVTLYDERQAHLSALQRLAKRNAPAITDQSSQDDIQDAEYTQVTK